jgi:hypothetical protein
MEPNALCTKELVKGANGQETKALTMRALRSEQNS